LAILNGWAREAIFAPVLADAALPASGFTLCLLIIGASICGIRFLGRKKLNYYLITGIYWIFLTIVFEFGMGLVLMKSSFYELLSAYDIRTGNLWLLVIIVMGLAPLISAKIKGLI